MMYSFPDLKPVCCSMSSSNCCFLTCMQISQEAGQVVWYFHHLKNFPQFVVIHIVSGFGVTNKEEVDVFWNSLAFSMIQQMWATWSLIPLAFLNPAWTSGSSWFMYCQSAWTRPVCRLHQVLVGLVKSVQASTMTYSSKYIKVFQVAHW